MPLKFPTVTSSTEYTPVELQPPGDNVSPSEQMLLDVPGDKKRPWFYKLSRVTIATLFASSICLPAAIGFLSFLWSNPKGAETSHNWYRIVLGDWTLKSVTITALIIRTAISVQAGIATSMLASIILERSQVMVHNSASIAAIRFINDGPLSLVVALNRTFEKARLWTSIAVALFATTLLLQFTSTGLVTDVGIGTLFLAPQEQSTLVGVSSTNINLTDMRSVRAIPYWMEAAPNFPVFAERRENASSKETLEGIRDTGLTYRAFLPFTNSTLRRSIKQFQGIATVLDSRVTCVRPKIHSGLSVGFTDELGFFLNGTFIPDSSPEGLILSDEPSITKDIKEISYQTQDNTTVDMLNITMDWAQQVQFAHDAGEWNIVQKQILRGPGLVSSMDPRYPSIVENTASKFEMYNAANSSFGLYFQEEGDSIPLMTGRSYELINVSASANNPTMINKSGANHGFYFSTDNKTDELVLTEQDEWLVFTLPRIPGWHVSVSLCFDSFISVDANVTIATNNTAVEPELGSWNSESGRFDTRSVRKQLGVFHDVSQTLEDRSLMELQTTPKEIQEQVEEWIDSPKITGMPDFSLHGQNFIRDSIQDKGSFGIYMCAGCGLQVVSDFLLGYSNNNPLQQQVFQDVMRTTNDSARAWQAYFTLLSRMAYYDVVSYFDVGDEASIAWFRSAQFPQSSKGLTAVFVILVLHCALILLIGFAFITRTNYSRVGDNAWQCLAQTHYDKVDNIFRSLTGMTDRQVRQHLAVNGLGDKYVSLDIVGEEPKQRTGLKMVD